MSDTTDLRGPELARAVFNHILEHLDTFDQSAWHSACNTKHCFAGHAQIMGGRPLNNDTARSDATELLNLSTADSGWLFDPERQLSEIRSFIYAQLHPEERDSAGYGRDGYNRAGFDRDGRDRAGFDRAGRDRAGYDRAGYNRAGYDRDGYNRDGYNRDGYDRDGNRLQPL